jgi:DNA adenine methylase
MDNIVSDLENLNITNETEETEEVKNQIKITKPFLKWAGGKTQIINTIMEKLPSEINNYHEIFIGGGSVLLALLSYIKNNKIKVTGTLYAYDINKILIGVYQNIQSKKDELYKKIKEYRNIYDKCKQDCVEDKKERKPITLEEAKKSKESYYYWLRKQFNENKDKSSVECSALFIVINKTCFRGLYREGPNGFNVPFGHYKTTPKMITEEHLDEISALIKDVKFECCDFSKSLKKPKENDFVYLDPPYAPENNTSFVDYNKDGFTLKNHNELFELTKSLHTKKIKFMMSNSKVKLVTDSFTDESFTVSKIECKRTINSKKPESKTMEVIITN